jgi:RHS repeat-associated protein
VYSPYGSIIILNPDFTTAPAGTVPMVNNLYQGMPLDPVTGLYYERARWYSPSLGTWISQDPAQYINGADTYQFVMSDPVDRVDPAGLSRFGPTMPPGIPGSPPGGLPFYQPVVVTKSDSGSIGPMTWHATVSLNYYPEIEETAGAPAPSPTISAVASLSLSDVTVSLASSSGNSLSAKLSGGVNLLGLRVLGYVSSGISYTSLFQGAEPTLRGGATVRAVGENAVSLSVGMASLPPYHDLSYNASIIFNDPHRCQLILKGSYASLGHAWAGWALLSWPPQP